MSGRMQQLAFLLLGLILFSGKSSQAGALHDFTASDAAGNNMLNRFDEKITFTRNQGKTRSGVLLKGEFPGGRAGGAHSPATRRVSSHPTSSRRP